MCGVASGLAVLAVGVVFDPVLVVPTVGATLAPGVCPREGGLDPVGCVVGERETDGARGRDGQQVAVAQPVLADALAQGGREPRGEVRSEIPLGVEEREGALLPGEVHRGPVGRVAHRPGDGRSPGPRVERVVAQAQHDQRVPETREAEPHPPLGGRFGALLRERPEGRLQDVVEHADGDRADLRQMRLVEAGRAGEGLLHESRQVDAAEAAAAIVGQGLLAAGIGRLQPLAVGEVVLGIGAVHEEDARLRVVVGAPRDGVEELAGAHRAVDPESVRTPVGAGGEEVSGRLRAMHQLPRPVGLHRPHEGVGEGDREVEVGELALGVLGVDEGLHVGVVAAQDAHLRTAPGACALDRLAHPVEYPHVRDRSRGLAGGAAHQRPLGTDAGEVIAHAAPPAHGLGGLGERHHDPGLAVLLSECRVADRLHEAVDEGCPDVGARGAHHPPGGDESRAHRIEETGLPGGGLALDGRQRAGYAPLDVLQGPLLSLGVLLQQDIDRDGLRGHPRSMGPKGSV